MNNIEYIKIKKDSEEVNDYLVKGFEVVKETKKEITLLKINNKFWGSKNKVISMKELDKEIMNCQECNLSKTRGKVVSGEGNVDSKILIVGEGVGKTNNIEGRPWVGYGGKIINDILSEAGLKREDIFLTNVMKCIVPNLKLPNSEQITSCKCHLSKQLEILKPKFVICVGKVASELLMEKSINLKDYENIVVKKKNYKLLVTYHPSSTRYNKEFKTKIIDTFKLAIKH